MPREISSFIIHQEPRGISYTWASQAGYFDNVLSPLVRFPVLNVFWIAAELSHADRSALNLVRMRWDGTIGTVSGRLSKHHASKYRHDPAATVDSPPAVRFRYGLVRSHFAT